MTRPDNLREVNPYLGRPIKILLVEDSPSDRALTIEALRDGRVLNELFTASDGEWAMQFLRQEGDYADAPRPDLVILDLNLPRKDGREVLQEIKADDRLKSLPVIILTTSAAEEDVLAMYELQAAAYVTKPVGFDNFIAAVRGIEDFWLSVVRLPSR
jgi:two-component system, chemotaxis family, response regulator Rcp1